MRGVLAQGPNLVGAGANIAGAQTDWGTPGNVTADDGSNAATASADDSDLLACTSCGLTLPTDRNARVEGILVELTDFGSAGAGTWTVALTKNGTSVAGTGKSRAMNGVAPGWQSFGAQDDLWGTTWTVAEINASTFGVLLDATGIAQQYRVDAVRVTVFFSQDEFRYEAAMPRAA